MVALRINNQEFDVETAQKMIDAGLIGTGQKHDTSSTTPNVAPPHGVFPGNNNMYGLFSSPGVRPDIWDATPRVRSFGSRIPMYPTDVYQELIEVATGVTAGSGNNVTDACTVGPKPGQLKKAKIASTFGIIHISTKIFDITQAGLRRSRADEDRRVNNRAMVNNSWLPMIPGMDGTDYVNRVMATEMHSLGIELERNVSQVHFVGVQGTENNTYRGVARQWNGLDRLIRNDWTDFDSGLAIAALAAHVVSFNAAADGGTDSVGRNIVAALIDTYYGQVDFLNRLGISPEIGLVMRPELFRALAAVWSCAYNTTRCLSSNAGQPLVRDAVSVRAEYEAILNGLYLPMEGTNVPVILDDSIARETLGNGYYKSDIYGVMFSGNGVPTLYGEYFDMNNPDAQAIQNFGSFGSNTTTINDGLYRVFKRETGGCIEYDFFARPRLITTTPFAHFRVDDVFHRADYRITDAQPGLSGYRNGGLTYSS